MDHKEFIQMIDEAISNSCYTIHEEEISAGTWSDKTNAYFKTILNMIEFMPLIKECPSKTLSCSLLILGGCLGNSSSTQKLCRSGDALYNLAETGLSSLLSVYNLSSPSELLSFPVNDNLISTDLSVFDKLIEEASRCISSCSSDSNTNPLIKCPLFRDAMLWAANIAKYPILSDSKQLNYLHPLALQILEDYRPQLKLCGLYLLKHLSTEVLMSCWRITGRCEATLDVLMTQRSAYSETCVSYS